MSCSFKMRFWEFYDKHMGWYVIYEKPNIKYIESRGKEWKTYMGCDLRNKKCVGEDKCPVIKRDEK